MTSKVGFKVLWCLCQLHYQILILNIKYDMGATNWKVVLKWGNWIVNQTPNIKISESVPKFGKITI